MAGFLNANSADEIVFTSGATAALNLVAHAFGATLQPGDRVLISVAEHHSNFVPWQMLRDRCSIEMALIPVGADGRLDAAIDTVSDSLLLRPGEADLRGFCQELTLTLQAALLARHAPPAVADAFIASRLGRSDGRVFGTLPSGCDVRAIVERAAPQ